jgi:rhamnulokinase
MAPDSMIGAIKELCAESGQPVPQTTGELMFCVYQSLADCYAAAVRGLERTTGKLYDRIAIVGGGSKDRYLCRLTAAACQKKVTAGPSEGTAIGNILVQMITAGLLPDISAAREVVRKSFEVTEEN